MKTIAEYGVLARRNGRRFLNIVTAIYEVTDFNSPRNYTAACPQYRLAIQMGLSLSPFTRSAQFPTAPLPGNIYLWFLLSDIDLTNLGPYERGQLSLFVWFLALSGRVIGRHLSERDSFMFWT